MTGLFAGLVMFVALVVIHELGHFVAAKLFGVGVPVFSVGMGPRIWGFTWHGTEYRLSALPVGGYVRLAGADPFGDENPDEQVDPALDMMRRPVYQRLVIMAAGPAFNLALPLVVFSGVLMFGEPQSLAIIGMITPDGAALSAGLQPGDQIRAVQGAPVRFWRELADALTRHANREVRLEVDRAGEVIDVTLPAQALRLQDGDLLDYAHLGISPQRVSTRVGVDFSGSAAYSAGLRTGDAIATVDGVAVSDWTAVTRALRPDGEHHLTWLRVSTEGSIIEQEGILSPPLFWPSLPTDGAASVWGLSPAMLYVGKVYPNTAAAMAGVRAEDRLLAINRAPVRAWSDVSIPDTDATVAELRTLWLVRDGIVIEQPLIPRVEREFFAGEVRYRPIMGLGLYPDALALPLMAHGFYPPQEAIPRAAEETSFLFQRTLGVMGRLFTGEVKPTESLGGPIEIFRVAGVGADQGIHAFLRLMGTISISLGMVNLLPVPVLDGGQILFYAIEGLRGRPLSLALRERIQMVGVLFLAAVMVMVMVMDVGRLFSGE